MPSLQEQFGSIDIYLFDQILKGRIVPGMRIVDAGCGSGRNLVYFLRHGYDVYGADADAQAVEKTRILAGALAPALPASNFHIAGLEHMPFPDAFAEVVLCSAVLHFARDEAHFNAMLDGVWRVLKPGGLFFSRLASTIGTEGERRPISLGERRYRMPDGREWLLVDAGLLEAHRRRLGAEIIEPLKTTVVQNLRSLTGTGPRAASPRDPLDARPGRGPLGPQPGSRSMTTWVLRKPE